MTPLELVEEYILDHDLRSASQKIYRAAINAFTKNFGQAAHTPSITRRQVLAWRSKVLDQGLSKRSWNTYSNHLRTIWSYAIEHQILPQSHVNPFKKTTVVPPKRSSKTVNRDAIRRARNWLIALADQERGPRERAKVTPAWFWLATFEMFYYTGIRLNALLCLRLQDVDLANQLIVIRGDTEKTHREYCVPIMTGLAPHIYRLLSEAELAGFKPDDQLFNVNRFSRHYRKQVMDTDQVEAMYKKLTQKIGIRMTPHRFRHTLASDLMKQPERNIHLTKSLLNHSNIATTMGYIEADYDHMRDVLHERSVLQGAIQLVRRADESGAPSQERKRLKHEQGSSLLLNELGNLPGADTAALQRALTQDLQDIERPALPPADLFSPRLLFTLMSARSGNPISQSPMMGVAALRSGGSS